MVKAEKVRDTKGGFVQILRHSAKEFWDKDFVFSVAVVQDGTGFDFLVEIFRGRRSEACKRWMFFEEYLEELSDRLEMSEELFIFGITDENETDIFHDISNDPPKVASKIASDEIFFVLCALIFAVLFCALVCKTY